MTCSDCCEWFIDLIFNSNRENELIDSIADGADDGGDPEEKTKRQPGSNPDVPTDGQIECLKMDTRPFKRSRMKQLFNRHGYNLAIFPGGIVKGKLVFFSMDLNLDSYDHRSRV